MRTGRIMREDADPSEAEAETFQKSSSKPSFYASPFWAPPPFLGYHRGSHNVTLNSCLRRTAPTRMTAKSQEEGVRYEGAKELIVIRQERPPRGQPDPVCQMIADNLWVFIAHWKRNGRDVCGCWIGSPQLDSTQKIKEREKVFYEWMAIRHWRDHGTDIANCVHPRISEPACIHGPSWLSNMGPCPPLSDKRSNATEAFKGRTRRNVQRNEVGAPPHHTMQVRDNKKRPVFDDARRYGPCDDPVRWHWGLLSESKQHPIALPVTNYHCPGVGTDWALTHRDLAAAPQC
ncbi:hypothetical protein SODALDRAFT_380424 [Sodiomyces alkalinus F11]|uniref:Uncharacterized protein n=1 Tax=Sodiomyces alkalinus (strain CBS 110278 / VKM F-3762 / F11) TaxID=1314773 RepID=A0A3N2PRG3_SODAK|nr:hypothetical protein SODALDRAFT_380424 [Sodiomyces alkalinus F11]ROT36936.1 hypothetical protein SODALDRAFT_380424 [Sodiomyces alkalinus F11]